MRLPRRTVMFLAKALVSAAFVAILLRTVRLDALAGHFGRLDSRYLAGLAGLAAVGIYVSCLKWRLLIAATGATVSLRFLMGLYLLGYFFNNFLPGMVGGDAARGYYLGRHTGRYARAYMSVFMERFTGLLALLFMAALVVLLRHRVVALAGIRVAVWITVAAAVPLVVVVYSERVFSVLVRLMPPWLQTVRVRLEQIRSALAACRGDRALIVRVLALSVAFHILTGLNLYFACRALRFDVALADMILTAPLIILISLLPITINGFGLWEGSFAVFFGLLGIPESVAVAAALLLRMKNVIVSVLGWFVYSRLGPAEPGAMAGQCVPSAPEERLEGSQA